MTQETNVVQVVMSKTRTGKSLRIKLGNEWVYVATVDVTGLMADQRSQVVFTPYVEREVKKPSIQKQLPQTETLEVI